MTQLIYPAAVRIRIAEQSKKSLSAKVVVSTNTLESTVTREMIADSTPLVIGVRIERGSHQSHL